jgi:hypothetical protein
MAQMSVERLTEFGESWNKNDPDLVASFFTEDGSLVAATGPEPEGRSYFGKDGVRQAVREFYAHYPGAQLQNTNIFVSGEVGILEWELVFPDGEGGETRIIGCDLLQLQGDLVHRKSAFQKRRT